MGFPGRSDDKESTCNVGDLGSIPGLGGSPGGKHGNPLRIPAWSEYSLEGLMLKLKFHYFGHLMRRADSLGKELYARKD